MLSGEPSAGSPKAAYTYRFDRTTQSDLFLSATKTQKEGKYSEEGEDEEEEEGEQDGGYKQPSAPEVGLCFCGMGFGDVFVGMGFGDVFVGMGFGDVFVGMGFGDVFVGTDEDYVADVAYEGSEQGAAEMFYGS